MAHSFPRLEHEITLQQNDEPPKYSAVAVRREPREKSGGTGDDQTRSAVAARRQRRRCKRVNAVVVMAGPIWEAAGPRQWPPARPSADQLQAEQGGEHQQPHHAGGDLEPERDRTVGT